MPIGTDNKSHDDTSGNVRRGVPKPLVVLASNWMVSNGLLSQDQVLGWAKSMQQRDAANAMYRFFAEKDREYEEFVLAQDGIVQIGAGNGNKAPRLDHATDANDNISDPDKSMGGLGLLASSFASDAAASLTREEWETVFQMFKSKYSEELGGATTYDFVRPDDIPHYWQMWYAPALRADTRKALNMLISVGVQELNDVVVLRHRATDLVLKQTGLGIAKLVLRVMRAEDQMSRLVVLYYLGKLEGETARQDAVRFAKHFNLGRYMDIHWFETAARRRQAERKS